jgi:hypothetical protein
MPSEAALSSSPTRNNAHCIAKAKTLTKEDIARALDSINTPSFAQRNKAMMLLANLTDIKIGEVALLR